MERVAMYLRKSREDIEAEKQGKGETLKKHREALFEFAKNQKLNVIEIYPEVKSGEKLIYRPEMQRLLDDVENGEYQAVLVMDIDRLGRGDMQEQGLILNAFRESNTKIITPGKTYDLRDESDELMTEIQTLFARQELKIITRRMQRGRVQSVKSGNYIGTRPPYGYEIRKEGKARWLVPHPEQAEIVKQIFDWYVNGDPIDGEMGANKIAAKLNGMGFKSYTGRSWESPSILSILKNEVYLGIVQWKKKEYKKTQTGRESKARPRDQIISAEGKHEALVSQATFQKAHERLKKKYHSPYQLTNGIANPLAGLIRCGKCGRAMVLRPYTNQASHIMCTNKECDCRSSRFEFVEKAMLQALRKRIADFEVRRSEFESSIDEINASELKRTALVNLEKEKEELERQKAKLFDLLERGIYDDDTYLERSKNLAERIQSNKDRIEQISGEMNEDEERVRLQREMIPLLKSTIDLYEDSAEPGEKNTLLKAILSKIEYKKERHQRNDDFEIRVFPKTNQNR